MYSSAGPNPGNPVRGARHAEGYAAPAASRPGLKLSRATCALISVHLPIILSVYPVYLQYLSVYLPLYRAIYPSLTYLPVFCVHPSIHLYMHFSCVRRCEGLCLVHRCKHKERRKGREVCVCMYVHNIRVYTCIDV